MGPEAASCRRRQGPALWRWLLLAHQFMEANALRNYSQVLSTERRHAEALWRQGAGMLWFQHLRRAGGTSLCHLLHNALPLARFLEARGEACQPEAWKLRDAMAWCRHNASLIALELSIFRGNAFAQEYGPVPGRTLLSGKVARRQFQNWVFVTGMRDPWDRFWSQLRHEMSTCLSHAYALAHCMGGHFEELGFWWSPSSHEDAVLGVPDFRISSTPEIYVDNYYTRILVNKTEATQQLTDEDLQKALALLTHRFSAVVIIEDFARSALQLACSLGLDVQSARAQKLLQTHVRPYSRHQAMLRLPTESELGAAEVQAVRTRFIRKNRYDYALYAQAKLLSVQRVARCAREMPAVQELLQLPPEAYEVNATDEVLEQLTIDDLFGCTNGSLEVTDNGTFLLKCPRSLNQHSTSWWSGVTDEPQPERKPGQLEPGAQCWKDGFSWPACCATRFGPGGNKDCWDSNFGYQECCVTE